jgi:hypothetical protein
MTSAPPFPPETNDPEEPTFWRGLWDTTLSYLKWGYGALAISFVAYGLYRIYQSQLLLQWVLSACLIGLFIWSVSVLLQQNRERRERMTSARIRAHELLHQFRDNQLSETDLSELTVLLLKLEGRRANKLLTHMFLELLATRVKTR